MFMHPKIHPFPGNSGKIDGRRDNGPWCNIYVFVVMAHFTVCLSFSVCSRLLRPNDFFQGWVQNVLRGKALD